MKFVRAGMAFMPLILFELKVIDGFLIGVERSKQSAWCVQSRIRSSLRSHSGNEKNDMISDRRHLFSTFATTVASVLITSSPSNAFEKAYPIELGFANGDASRDLSAIRREKILKKKQNYQKSMDYATEKNLLAFRGPKDVFTCFVWGGALWFLSGSRSNPLVTPIANVFYDEEKEDWLKDRNDGLFASLPNPLYAILFLVFLAFGVVADRIILLLAEGSANVTLQLAVVALINGGFFELGRIASGEKGPTRDQFDRTTQLRDEFNEFALKRLRRGGNCHRKDVVRAFRRYFSQYRVENDEYPLTDLEIEKLLREWNSVNTFAEMTSAGFYNGLSIDKQADAFA